LTIAFTIDIIILISTSRRIIMEKTKSRTKIYNMTLMAMMAAVMCILGPLSIPIGAVPISFTNLVIYFAVMLIGTKYGTVSYILYMLIGIFGLPVFSGYSGGMAKLMGPTGGYIIGFIFMALISGFFINISKGKKSVVIIGMIIGTIIAYAFGTAWFVFITKCGIIYALAICVLPFILGDLVKILIAVFLGSYIKKQVIKAGIL
jgi:biotin transport system substrate-specific component